MIKVKINRNWCIDKEDDYTNHTYRWLVEDNYTVYDLINKICSEYDLPKQRWFEYNWDIYINKQKCAYISKKSIEFYVDKNKTLKEYQINNEFINIDLNHKYNDRITFKELLIMLLIIIVILISFIISYLSSR